MLSSTNASRPRSVLTAVIVAFGLALSACAGGLSSGDYQRAEAGRVNRVDSGVIVASQQVQIEGTKSGVGTGAGAVIGGAAGSSIGGGTTENVIAGVAGAVVGGLVGAAVEEGATRQTGFTYTVRLDRTQELVTITQADQYPLPNGMPVFIQYGARARIVPQQSAPAYPQY